MKSKSKSVPQSTKGERVPAQSWQDIELTAQAIIFTLSSAELLKSTSLALLQSLSDSITSLAADTPQPADKPYVSSCSSCLLHLLAKLLSVRKRSRDWKQAAYCGSVTAVLAASTAVRRLEGRMHWGVDPMKHADIISRVALALDETTQLLSSQSDALQSLSQQQPAAHPQQTQQQQQQLLQQLQHLACLLLQWCCTRCVLTSMETHGRTSLQLRAVKLAAVLAHSLTNQEPTTAHAALPYMVIYDLLDRLFYLLVHLVHKDNSKGAVIFAELHRSPAFMQLSLLLLLQLQIFNLKHDKDPSSSSSSSSSSHCGNGTVQIAAAAAAAPVAAAAASASCSSSSSSSLNSSADPAAAAQQPPQQQQSDNTHQAYALIQQLWRAAGFAPEAMHGNWQLALQATLEGEGLLPLTLKAAGLQGLAVASKKQHSSKSKAIPSLALYETLPGAPDNMLQGCVILTQALGKCVAQCSSCDKGFDLDSVCFENCICYENCIEKLQQSGPPSRQQQQLLQAVVWRLPLFLLQTAARFGPQEALVTRVAAEAAWFCCTCWQAPALLPAAQQQPAVVAAAATASGDSSTYAAAAEPQQPPEEQLLLPMLEAWLQLIQQQLLQPHVGLLCVATAARQQQQQGCGMSNQQTKPVLDGPVCSCSPFDLSLKHSGGVCHASISNSSSSSSSLPPTCALECGRLHCLGVLLTVLQPLSYLCNTPGSAAVWSSKLAAVLLVFEVIIRQLLPLAVPCSSSGGESGGRKQGVKRSSAVVPLYEMLNDSLFELLDMRKGKQAPLKVVLLGPEAAGSASETHSNKEPQQQHSPPQQQQPSQQQPCAAELAVDDTGLDSPQQQQQSAQLLHQELHLLLQQSAQLLQVQRHFFSVIASHLKLCRCPGSPAQPYGYVFGHALQLVDKVARVQANLLLSFRDTVHTSLSEARAALAPWLALMGAYLSEAAVSIPQQRGGVVEVLNPDRAAEAAEELTWAVRNCDDTVDQVLELLDQLGDFVADIWRNSVFEKLNSSGASGSIVIIDSSSSGGSSGDAAAGSSCSRAENTFSSSSSTAADTTSGSSNISTAVSVDPSSSSNSGSSGSNDGDGVDGGNKLEFLCHPVSHPPGTSSQGKEDAVGLSDRQPVGNQDNKQQQQQQQQQQEQEDDTAGSAAAAGAAGVERLCTPYDGLCAELDILHDMQDLRNLCANLMGDVMDDDTTQGGPGITTECGALYDFLDDPCFDDLAHKAKLLGIEVCRKAPAPWCCNNPDCINMTGVSELQLIGAKSCVCGGCKVARYCSRSCQAAHWTVHRSVCSSFSVINSHGVGVTLL